MRKADFTPGAQRCAEFKAAAAYASEVTSQSGPPARQPHPGIVKRASEVVGSGTLCAGMSQAIFGRPQ